MESVCGVERGTLFVIDPIDDGVEDSTVLGAVGFELVWIMIGTDCDVVFDISWDPTVMPGSAVPAK